MLVDEDDLRFDFREALNVRKFDDETTHGLSHCMKAVDFIIEFRDKILFLEVKDPDNPKAHIRNVGEFNQSLQSDALIRNHMIPKCRDTFIYEYCMDRINKPIYYLVLIALKTLTEAELSNQTDVLKKLIPVNGPPESPWIKKYGPSGFAVGKKMS